MNSRSALELLYHAAAHSSSTPGLDAQVLLAHILGEDRSWVIAHPEAELNPSQTSELERARDHLSAGEPLPYILGSWEFYGLSLQITPGVLIPRPETELLVDQAAACLSAQPERRWALDVGTGSGCIAVALASQIPDLSLVACDISWQALSVARQNIHRYNLSQRIHLLQADLLLGIQPPPHRKFDLIVANLPYIPARTLEGLAVSRWEPTLALNGGADGLDLIRSLLEQAPGRLAPKGQLILEIEHSQGQAAVSLASTEFPSAEVSLLQDLAGHDRLVCIQV